MIDRIGPLTGTYDFQQLTMASPKAWKHSKGGVIQIDILLDTLGTYYNTFNVS